MKTASKSLPSDPEILKNIVQELQSVVAELSRALLQKDVKLVEKDAHIEALNEQYQQILEQFRLAQQKQFGSSSETSANQLGLFNEAEQIEAEDEPELATEPETISYSRNKPKRKPLPNDLPRESMVHDIKDKTCDCCGYDLHRMGEETSEQLEFIPASIKVIENIRPKYSCRHCEQQGTEVSIKIAPVPPTPIPKSIATASLLAQIITSKYQYALPLYRQESLFKQYGIELSRKTMADWMIRSGEILQPIYQRLKAVQLQQSVVHADETPLKVIHEDKSRCYMWVYCTGSDSPNEDPDTPPNIVLYDYQNSRSGQCASDYLRGYQGYLQVDGYQAYEQTQASLVGCFAHARRKFIDAQKMQVKGKTGKADWAISHIQKLYRIEAEIKGQSTAEKQTTRQLQSKPLLDQFKAWLDKSALQVPPKSAIGKAIAYSLNQWNKLTRYTEDGRLNIDNNRAERAVKPFVIGRKNWMFSNTATGAKGSAVLYSLVETAKANGLIPFDYIRYLLDGLSRKPDDIEHLMPWNVDLSGNAKS
jgi:transposase